MPECIVENNVLSPYFFALCIHLREQEKKGMLNRRCLPWEWGQSFKYAGVCWQSPNPARETGVDIIGGLTKHGNTQSALTGPSYRKKELPTRTLFFSCAAHLAAQGHRHTFHIVIRLRFPPKKTHGQTAFSL